MDDVIFAGTASRPPRDFAEVSILLERERRRRAAAAGESEITRRIERGAGSAYRIDGRDVRAEGRRLAVCRCGDRRPFAGPRQPGQDRRGDRRQAGRAPDAARGGGRHFRAPRAAQGRRAEIARGRGQSGPARRNPRRPGAARRAASAPGPRRRTLPQAHRPDPRGRGAAAPCALGRGRSGPPRPRPPKPKARPKKSNGSIKRSPRRRRRTTAPRQRSPNGAMR